MQNTEVQLECSPRFEINYRWIRRFFYGSCLLADLESLKLKRPPTLAASFQRNLEMTGSMLVASASGDPTAAQITIAKTTALENVHNAKRIRASVLVSTDQRQ